MARDLGEVATWQFLGHFCPAKILRVGTVNTTDKEASMPARACLGALLKAEHFLQIIATADVLCVATLGQGNSLQGLRAWATWLATMLLAWMASRAVRSYPPAFLEAFVLLVAWIVGVA